MKKVLITSLIFLAGFMAANCVHAAGYSYYRSITVTSTTSIASGTNANFPMLVSSTLSSFKPSSLGGRIQNLVTAPNGGQEPADLIFVTSTPVLSAGSWNCGTPLKFETESYVSSTGALSDWVSVPSLSAGSVIYACYGASTVNTDQSHPSSTWNANFLQVYHLASPTGTVNILDSTANASNGTNTSIAPTTGQIGGGGNFDGSTSTAILPTGVTGGGARTVSLWFKSTSQEGNIYSSGVDSNSPFGQAFSLYMNAPGGGAIYFQTYGSDNWTAFDVVPTSTWTQVVAQYTGSGVTSDATMHLYINGQLQSLAGSWDNVTPNTFNGNFGLGFDPNQNNIYLQGAEDELEVSTVVLTPSWILTEYNNQANPGTFYSLGNEVASGYSYYRSITVTSNTSIASGTNANFPMLVSSTLSSFVPASFGGRIQNLVTAPNGGQEPADLIFVTSTPAVSGGAWNCGTPLNFETEKYTSSTGALIDWVNVPSISAGSVIYVCYGNASLAIDQSHPSATWNSNYTGVWHFPTPTSTLNVKDSTALNTSLNNGSTPSSTGQVDGAVSFDGSTQYVTTSLSMNPSVFTSSTMSAWINLKSFTNGDGNNLMALSFDGTNGGNYRGWGVTTGGNLVENVFGSATTQTISLNTWYYVSVIYSSSDIVVDVNTSTYSFGSTGGCCGPNSGTLNIGWDGALNAGFPQYWNGAMDEVHITKTALSPSWIRTEYNNQANPGTFYAIGSEQAPGTSSVNIKRVLLNAVHVVLRGIKMIIR